MTTLAGVWTGTAAIGYPALFGGVLLGSIIPVVPTGALVGAAAALATAGDELSLPVVVLLAAVGALVGDLVTVVVARLGSDAAVHLLSRGQHPERLAIARRQFTEHGWALVVAGRMLPAGRIPVLLAAGTLRYPWHRLLPAASGACLLWAGAYAAIGVFTGGLFDDPLIAPLIAAAAVLLIGAVASLVGRRRAAARGGKP